MPGEPRKPRIRINAREDRRRNPVLPTRALVAELKKTRNFSMTVEDAIQLTRKFESDSVQIPWGIELVQKALIANGFSGKARQFMHKFVYQLGKDGRFHSHPDPKNQVIKYIEQEPAKKKQRQQELLTMIKEAQAQLKTAMKTIFELCSDIKAMAHFPDSSAIIRHDLANTKDIIQIRLLRMQKEIEHTIK